VKTLDQFFGGHSVTFSKNGMRHCERCNETTSAEPNQKRFPVIRRSGFKEPTTGA